MRGAFANIRLRNLLVPGVEGGYTVHLPDGKQTTIFDAAESYRAEGVPLILIVGKEYGSGSSRDWAAKDRSFWASGQLSPRASNGSIGAIWSGWACSRWNS